MSDANKASLLRWRGNVSTVAKSDRWSLGSWDYMWKFRRQPRWASFDPIWYSERYQVQEPLAFYLTIGKNIQNSVNIYFDEVFYISRYASEIQEKSKVSYLSGFEHYCRWGHVTLSPNCLFDELFYRKNNTDLFDADGAICVGDYINGYEHYLCEGAYQGRRPSHYYDESVWRLFSNPDQDDCGDGRSPLERCLTQESTKPAGGPFLRTSWYFDPDWYLMQYPEVARAIEADTWSSPLAHYLGNSTPICFNPNEHFSEKFYAETYRDVEAAVAAGIYRNGYEHFLDCGAREGRRPTADIDLLRFVDAQVQIEIDGGLYPEPFAYYVASHLVNKPSSKSHFVPSSERQGKLLFAQRANMAASILVRNHLDFTVLEGRVPQLSVVIVLHNQFSLTMLALASLHAQHCDLDLILVDSGSFDETRRIERYIEGAQIVRFSENVGYIAGCNAGLSRATAPAILYMNNDVVLGPLALVAALRRLMSCGNVGAVGGKIVRAHGLLQEAGCILWRDGRTSGYMRNHVPHAPEANFVREVDFCSGAFLLVRTNLARNLGGFDPVFRPAYYEDTDFCVRIRRSGYVVIYDPDVLVHHYEYGSSSEAQAANLIAGARDTFCRRNADFLRFQYNYRGTEYIRARGSRRGHRRILFIEDRVPYRWLGSGYVRSNDIIHAMVQLGYEVTVYPVQRLRNAPASVREGFPNCVEIMYDRGAESLASFINERSGMYDLVWVGRTHNLNRLLPLLACASGEIPDFGMILDTEAVVSPREIAKRNLLDQVDEDGVSLDEALEKELACARFCQSIVAVNQRDADYIELRGHSRVHVLGHLAVPRPTERNFSERRGILFVGALHSEDSPNFDSLRWFVKEVLPLIVCHLGTEIQLTIAGYVADGISLRQFSDNQRLHLVGEVDDLSPLYDRHRVFVAPTRYAGGIPYKVHEAAAFGLPVVATSLLCAQLGWTDGVEIFDGGVDDAELFALQTVRLYEEATAWHHVREASLARITAECGQNLFQKTLAGILNDTLASAASCNPLRSNTDQYE